MLSLSRHSIGNAKHLVGTVNKIEQIQNWDINMMDKNIFNKSAKIECFF